MTAHTTMELEQMLTPKQAANVLGLAPQTLADWRCDGRGPRYYRLGGRAIRYKQSDLAAWVEAAAATPSQAA